MPAETGAGIFILKFGSLKLIGFGAALVGAAMMAAFRPPQSKRELFIQGAVALGVSLLFGGSVIRMIDHYFTWMDLAHSSFEDIVQSTAMVHGLLGAMAWGTFGGLAVLRDKLMTDPIKTIKEIKDI